MVIVGIDKRQFFFLLLLIVAVVMGELLYLGVLNTSRTSSKPYSALFNTRVTSTKLSIKVSNKITIGTICCRGNDSFNSSTQFQQALVLIKSVLISAIRFNISVLDFHIFLDHLEEDKALFRAQLQQLTTPLQSGLQATFTFYDAVNQVPSKYLRAFSVQLNNPNPRFRCSSVRLFFPTILAHVDSIIYLDTDIIITGNIMKLWNVLGAMDKRQLIGMGHNRQPDNAEFDGEDKAQFGPLPFVPPRGVNGGVQILNLTRIRMYGWMEKMVRLQLQYLRLFPGFMSNFNDQHTVNMLLHFYPEFLRIIPCTLNFLRAECERGFYCQPAKQDPEGLHLIHGTDRRFLNGKIFSEIYEPFRKFNISKMSNANFFKDVVRPIKAHYSGSNKRNGNNCFGTLNTIIFKSFKNHE